jgi:hypothetical protein
MPAVVSLRTDGKLQTVDITINKWLDYATGFLEGTEPILLTTITTGDVWSYNYGANTYYRLVPSGTLLDAFYTTFSGGILSGLLAKKPQTL